MSLSRLSEFGISMTTLLGLLSMYLYLLWYAKRAKYWFRGLFGPQESNNFVKMSASQLSLGDYENKATKKGSRKYVQNVEQSTSGNCCSTFLIILTFILVIIFWPLTIWHCFKTVQDYQRAIIFRFGKIKKKATYGPGLFFVLPGIDQVSNYFKNSRKL